MATALQALRSSTNLYDGVSDEGMLRHIQESYYPDKSFEEVGSMFGYSPASTEEPQEEEGNVTRGFKNSFRQLPQEGYGLLAAGAALGESALGEGGLATGAKKWAVDKYAQEGQNIAQHSKPTDSIDYAYEQATQGNLGALVDFTSYALGQAGGQGVQLLGTALMGGAAAKVAGSTIAKDLTEKLVAKEAEKIVAQDVAKELAEDQIQALAVKATAEKLAGIGSTTALGAMSFGMEGGEIGGELASQSVKEDRALSADEIAKGLGATVAAGSLDLIGDKFGLDVLTGKSKLLSGGFLKTDTMPGVGGRLARGGVAAATAAPFEAATEYGQTLLEAWGQGKDPFSEEVASEARTSAAMGFVGGGVMGQAGGFLSSAKPVEVPDNIAQASSVDEAIQAADNALRTPDARTLELRNYALESGKPQPKPTWEEPAFKINPDAEAIVRNRTVEAQPLQGFIDSRYQDTGYVPSELVFGKEATDEQRQAEADNLRNEIINRPTPKQEEINRAYYEKEQAELQQKEQDLLDAEMHPDATPAMVKQYRKARAEIETQRRQRADDFRKGLGFNIVPATTGEARNTQLADKLAQALSPKQQETRKKLNAVKLNAKTVTPQETQPTTQETASVPTPESQIPPEVTDAAYSTGTTTENNSAATSFDRAVTPENTGTGRTLDDGGNRLTGRGTGGNADGLSRTVQQSTIDSEPGRALAPILTQPKEKYLKAKSKEFDKANPKAIDAARNQYNTGIESSYDDDYNSALADAPFDYFVSLPEHKNLSPDTQLNLYNALRDDYKLTPLTKEQIKNGKGQNKTTQATEEAVNELSRDSIPEQQANKATEQNTRRDRDFDRNPIGKSSSNGEQQADRNKNQTTGLTYQDKALETAKKDLDYAQQQHTEKENMYAVATQKGIKPEQRRENLKAQFGLNNVQAEVITDIALKGKETFMRGTSESLKQATESLRKTEKAIEDEQSTQAPTPRTDTIRNETPVGSSKAEPDVLGEEATKESKQSWEMTLDEFKQANPDIKEIRAKNRWASSVHDAFNEGKPVPDSIIKQVSEIAPGFLPDEIATDEVLLDRLKPKITNNLENEIDRVSEAKTKKAKEINRKIVKQKLGMIESQSVLKSDYDELYFLKNRLDNLEAELHARNNLEKFDGDFAKEIIAKYREHKASARQNSNQSKPQSAMASSKTEPTIDDIPDEFKDKVKIPIAQGDKTTKVSASELIKDFDKIIADYKKFIDCMGGK